MNKQIYQKKLWVVLVMCATTAGTKAQAPIASSTESIAHIDITAAFTDPMFLAVIQRYTGNQVLYTDEVARITTLEIENSNIRSIAGLEHLVGLEHLIVRATSIVQLNLPSLFKLEEIFVSQNRSLQTLILPTLPALVYLSVIGNAALQTLSLPSLPMIQALVVLLNTALQTMTFAGALGSASIHTDIICTGNALRSLSPFDQIVEHQDSTIRSSLGRGDTLRVGETLFQNVSVLRNAGVHIQRYELL